MNIKKEIKKDLLEGKSVSQGYDINYCTTSIQQKIRQISKTGIKYISKRINKNTTSYKLIFEKSNIELAKNILSDWEDNDKYPISREILFDMINGKEIIPKYVNKYNSSKIRQIICQIKKVINVPIESQRIETKHSFYIKYYINAENIKRYYEQNLLNLNIPVNNENYLQENEKAI